MPTRIPNHTDLTMIRVVKITRDKATLQTLDGKLEFTFPAALLPENVEAGEKLSLKILDSLQTDNSHDDFARRLLEEIIN